MGASVLAATLEILAEHGFASLTIDEVAERAGVHTTTVYRRWGSRDGLVAAALASQGAAPPGPGREEVPVATGVSRRSSCRWSGG